MITNSCRKYADCHSCKLGRNGAPVPGKFADTRGSVEATLAIVGESPTATDIARKVLFSGPSGQLIDQVLSALDMSRKDVYFANALLCNYPSDSKPGKITIQACSTRLRQELKQLPKLRVIIACGKYALQSLTGREKITEELYNITWDEQLHAYIIPSYHPGFILKNIEAFEDLSWVFHTAKKLINSTSTGRLPVPAFNLQIAKNPDQAVGFLNAIANIDTPTTCVIDCESDDVNWYRTPMLALGFCLHKTEVFIIPWIYEHNPPAIEADEDFFVTPEMRDALERIRNNPNLRFQFHNGTFDVKLIKRNTDIHFPIHDDSMLMHYVLDERGGGDAMEGNTSSVKIGSHRLKVVARKYLLVPDWERDIKTYLPTKKVKYSAIPRPRLWGYLAYDVLYCGMLIDELPRVIAADEPPSTQGYPGPMNVYANILLPVQNELVHVEYDGVRVGEQTRKKLSTEMRKTINELYSTMLLEIRKLEGRTGPPPPRITKLGKFAANQPMEFNPRSPNHLKKLIYTTLAIPLTADLRTNEQGKVTKTAFPTGRDVLLKIRNKHPIIEMLIEYKIINKRYGTYVKPLPVLMDERDHIHSQIMITSTRTGRASSKDPNLQNLTKKIKQLYVPDED